MKVFDFFAKDGPLAHGWESYCVREGQIALAQAIEKAIQDQAILVAEAGTGIGKTWAYLAPILLANSKALISTGTRTLQDQLFNRDLPQICAILASPIRIALLKGRNNYVCHYHLDRLAEEDYGLKSRTEVIQLRTIQKFAQQSKTGDQAELAQLPEAASIWQRVTSTRENCLGQECPRIRDCFVMKARRQAQEADIVVINHALFMADLVLREEGVTDLLPQVSTVVFDEAHQLLDIATRFLGTMVSTHQLLEFAQTAYVTGLLHAREVANWSELQRQLEHAISELRLACAPLEHLQGRKATLEWMAQLENFANALLDVQNKLDDVIKVLISIAEHHPDLTAIARTGSELALRLKQWSASISSPVALAIDSRDPYPAVRWAEFSFHHLRFHMAPLSIADVFSKFRPANQAWILTSATLSLANNFDHFTQQLGLHDARTGQWESPFDYAKQGLLYVAADLPLPASPKFNECFVQKLIPLLIANSGGTLILCTTLRAVEEITELLAEAFKRDQLTHPLLKQGEASRGHLLERFSTLNRPVLVGSASFWQGIDLPGDILTLLAIDKLPFAPPDDPVIQARLRAYQAQGKNSFEAYQLPQAAIMLKQGVGRLIRTERDYGVLVVGDKRLVEKPYGKCLWRGLPPFSRTRLESEAVSFLEKQDSTRCR